MKNMFRLYGLSLEVVRELGVEITREPSGRDPQVVRTMLLFESGQLTHPPILEESEHRQQNADHHNQGQRRMSGKDFHDVNSTSVDGSDEAPGA